MKKKIFLLIIAAISVTNLFILNKQNKKIEFSLNQAKAECIPVNEIPGQTVVLLMYNCLGDMGISGCDDSLHSKCTYGLDG